MYGFVVLISAVVLDYNQVQFTFAICYKFLSKKWRFQWFINIYLLGVFIESIDIYIQPVYSLVAAIPDKFEN